MNSDAFYARFSSDCIIGSANQELVRLDQPQTITGRCRYRLAHGGAQFSLLFSNIIDSTYADGSVSRAGDVGGTWTIHQMRIGLRDDDRAAEPAQWFPVTFDGAAEKTVSGAVTFATDPVALHARAGQTLCYELTFTGDCYPHHPEALLPVEVQTDDGFVPDKRIPLPLMIGCDRPVRRRIGFIGDSITQGIGTETGSYAHWAARIAARIPADCSAWDMGSGYARAADAAQDGAWRTRAKTCDLVHVCFGVNDLYHDRRTADEVLADLQTIVRALKHAGCTVILLTVPPFDWDGSKKIYWYRINDAIRAGAVAGIDGLFDFAAVVGQPAPNAHLAKYGGHPDAAGCQAVADAYWAAIDRGDPNLAAARAVIFGTE